MNKTKYIGSPGGARVMFGQRLSLLRSLENKCAALFAQNGFTEVRTPLLEYYGLFADRHIPEESMWKSIAADGKIVVIRPDSTIPVMRVVQTLLSETELPLKLFYIQPVFRANTEYDGHNMEFTQAGAEWVGLRPNRGFVLSFCRDTLMSLGVREVSGGTVLTDGLYRKGHTIGETSYYSGDGIEFYSPLSVRPLLSGGEYEYNGKECFGFAIDLDSVADVIQLTANTEEGAH